MGNGPDLERNADVVCVCFCVCVCIMAFSQGMDDWRVHEGNTHVGGGKDGDGVHDVGARWPTHQVSFDMY